jgi:3-hydroxybutyryl-CoA dehydrogenase
MNINDVKRVAVVGAGTMGSGISLSFAIAGYEVSMMSRTQKTLDHSSHVMKSSLATLVEYGSVKESEIPSILSRVHSTTDLAAAVKDVQFVTEVVAEIPDVKKQIIGQLDEYCAADTIISSSTSGLDVFAIAADAMKRPERLVMAHWYTPPHIIPLVEVAPGEKTSSDITKLTAAILEKVGKVPIVMKRFLPGFVANKIQHAYASAMFALLSSEVVEIGDIDKAVKYVYGIRLPIVGIVQSMDFNGLDTVNNICKTLKLDVPIIEKNVAAGNLGAVTGKGIYDYQGRSEEEILKKRDTLYLKMYDFLKSINAFEPV